MHWRACIKKKKKKMPKTLQGTPTLQKTGGIHAHMDNRRPPTTQAYPTRAQSMHWRSEMQGNADL